MVAVLGYLTLQFGLYGIFGAVCADALQAQFGFVVPWWVCALGAIATVAYFGYSQIDFSAKLLAGFVMAEYFVVMVLDFLILDQGAADGINFVSFAPPTVMSGNPSIGLLFCFAAFIGFEATTIYSEEAKNPRRSIPFATYAALLLVGGFYSFSLWCLILGAGADRVVSTIIALGEPTTFLYVLSEKYAGTWFTVLLRGMFMMSIYVGLIAFHNSTARYFFSMGREGLLPSVLGLTHPIYKSPHFASMLQTGLCIAVVLVFALCNADPVLTLFSWLSNLATVCVLALMVATALSVVVYFRRVPSAMGIVRTLVCPAIAGIGLGAVLMLALANFHVLTGASKALSLALIGFVPFAGVIGWLSARRLKRRDQTRFLRLGMDRGGERQ